MGSVAGEHPEPITAIFTGAEIIWLKKAFNATVLLHCMCTIVYQVCMLSEKRVEVSYMQQRIKYLLSSVNIYMNSGTVGMP